MKTIGFPISKKENEFRRALIPAHIKFLRHPEQLYIERGYGDVLGFKDEDYTSQGVHTCSHEEVLTKDIICDPKIGDAQYLEGLKNQTIFGWVHAVQNRDITDKIIAGLLTAYAWEDMFDAGRHVFYRNNEIAGEAAIMHAFLCHGVFPYGQKVAVLGRGNVAMGAVKALHYMGASVTMYDRRTEVSLRHDIADYDVIVNGILWDTSRHDHIIYKEDLKRMKPGALIIDISCDRAGGIETSIPTTIEAPDYMVEGIRHYVVDHTPSLFYKTSSEEISRQTVGYLDAFAEGVEKDNEVLRNCLALEQGRIVDQRINKFQNR